jgi:hypothetical protein
MGEALKVASFDAQVNASAGKAQGKQAQRHAPTRPVIREAAGGECVDGIRKA